MPNNTECWRPVVGFEESHEVSNHGNVRVRERRFARKHNKTNRVVEYVYSAHPVKQWIGTETGYPMVDIAFRGRRKKCSVHTMVLEAFIGARPSKGHVACHGDGSKTNNALSNLRWDTYVGNERDKIQHDTHVRGERNHAAKLTENDVVMVRARLKAGEACVSIARSLGVTPEAISRIKVKKNWAWLV